MSPLAREIEISRVEPLPAAEGQAYRMPLTWALAALAGWLVLSLDGDIFWDEAGYLYVAAYVGQPDFLNGTFQPSTIENFYLPKILHLLVVKAIVAVTGPGLIALAAIMGLYALLVAGSLLCIHAALRQLLPSSRHLAAAVALTAFAPVVLYLAFKTLPEAPALFFGNLALFAFVKSLQPQRVAIWIGVAVLSLVAVALTRHAMALLMVAFVVAALILPLPGLSRAKLIWRGLVVAVLSLAVTVAILALLGIPFERYLFAFNLAEKSQPLIFRLVSTALELGALWLLPVIALWHPNRPLLWFLLAWFLIATLPMLLLFSHLEARYLMQNLLPFAGLSVLALEVVAPVIARLAAQGGAVRHGLSAVLLVILLGSHWVALRLSPAELNVWQVQRMLDKIETRYGEEPYVLLSSWIGTDFQYLRFAYPQLPVYNVADLEILIADDSLPHRALEDRYFDERKLRSIEELEALPGKLVYFGFDETFMVANARIAIDLLPGMDSERVLPRDAFLNHLAASWMWEHPALEFRPLVEHGHYKAFDVRLRD